MTEVQIGDRRASVSKLNGYKASEALGIISVITEKTPELLHELADFTRTYEREHAQQMPRAAAEAKFPQQAANVSEAAWEAAGNVLAVPEPPGIEEQIAFALPKIYGVARDSLVDLLSLLIAPNSELEAADADGKELYGKEGALAEYRRQLLHDATLEQLVAVAVAAGDVLAEQLKAIDGGQLGKLLEVFGLKTAPQSTPRKASPAASAPSVSAPVSSSPSDEASDGPAATSSSEPPSERREPLPAS
jgi:hypothetical protein